MDQLRLTLETNGGFGRHIMKAVQQVRPQSLANHLSGCPFTGNDQVREFQRALHDSLHYVDRPRGMGGFDSYEDEQNLSIALQRMKSLLIVRRGNEVHVLVSEDPTVFAQDMGKRRLRGLLKNFGTTIPASRTFNLAIA